MNQATSIFLRAVIFIAIICCGIAMFKFLVMTKKEPPQVDLREQSLHVDVIAASFIDAPVSIEGFGQVRSRDVVSITPEVAGRVVKTHPKLESGEIIPANEVLFEVDPRDYQARVDESSASLKQINNSIERLKKQQKIDKQRLETFKRSKSLAKTEYERLKNLYEKDKVGTQSQVDTAELAYNQANDAYDQLALSLDLYPIRIQEARNSFDSATAMSKLAATNLERTKISVPFSARVKMVNIENGQYVSPGSPILTLADDSILEVLIPIDSHQARTWLEFNDTDNPTAWFENLKQVSLQLEWTEERNSPTWKGQLSRVEKFDPSTRTLTLVAQITAEQAIAPIQGNLPLVEGMFCKISIPGKIAPQVVQIPVESVSFNQDDNGYRTAFIAKEDPKSPEKLRLTKVKVLESHIKDESIFISKGLSEGDLIVVTRLINPLKESLLATTVIDVMEAD